MDTTDNSSTPTQTQEQPTNDDHLKEGDKNEPESINEQAKEPSQATTNNLTIEIPVDDQKPTDSKSADDTPKEKDDTTTTPPETTPNNEATPTPVEKSKTPTVDDYLKRFKACMVLSGVGDALGYKNGAYEFCRNGMAINGEVADKGGVEKIKVDARNWMVSDDTVMHLATAEALVSKWDGDYEKLYLKFAEKYRECMRDMSGRAPGNTCMTWTHRLRPTVPKGYVIPFNPRGGGCGAAMRAVPIGLYFNHPDKLNELVAVSIESGRMTHNHPTGYLGALAVALFVSYAFQRKPLIEWGAGLMETLNIAWKYIEKEGRDVEENRQYWAYFKERWEEYLLERGIQDGRSTPNFPENFDAKARDTFNKRMSFSGWGGSSGHDAPMIAYDALLGCEYNATSSWAELCSRGMFHGGDSDSTGIIAAACWGAWRGFEGVPSCNYQSLEYRDRLEKLGKQIHDIVMK